MGNKDGISNGDWTKWSNHIIKQLDYNREDHKEMIKKLNELENGLTVLKVKAGFIAAIASVVITVALRYIMKV